jgi:predicted phage baseplate assembly protein
LDDKTYKEILDEALSLIPHYTPEWTNHNPGDPGVTLVELFSWMTEMVLYRLNKVPEKTYLALLDLMGLTLSPPQASRVLLRFYPVKGHEGVLNIKKGLQVSTGRSDGQEAISLETDKRIQIQDNRVVSCISRNQTHISDISHILADSESAVPLFKASETVERYIYIEAVNFQFLKDPNIICIHLNQAQEVVSFNNELVRYLKWEYWDGSRWILLDTKYLLKGTKKQNNTVYFSGPLNIEMYDVEGLEGYYLRAGLDDLPEDTNCFDVNVVTNKLIFTGDGLLPDLCFYNSSSYLALDLDKDFKPFNDSPVVDDVFYLASDEV